MPELCGEPITFGRSKNGYPVENPRPAPGSCHQASIPAQNCGFSRRCSVERASSTMAALATFTMIAAGFIRRQFPRSDQAAGGLGQRQGDHQDVGGGEHLVKVG